MNGAAQDGRQKSEEHAMLLGVTLLKSPVQLVVARQRRAATLPAEAQARGIAL